MNKKTKTLVIIATLLSLHSCTLFYNAMAVGLAGVAGAAALEDKKVEKQKRIKEQKEYVLPILIVMAELDNVLIGQMNQFTNKRKLHLYIFFNKLYGIILI